MVLALKSVFEGNGLRGVTIIISPLAAERASLIMERAVGTFYFSASTGIGRGTSFSA